MSDEIRYREDAIERATAIVNGTWSAHHNVMLETEGNLERPQTLAAIAQADAAHVAMLCALAQVLPEKKPFNLLEELGLQPPAQPEDSDLICPRCFSPMLHVPNDLYEHLQCKSQSALPVGRCGLSWNGGRLRQILAGDHTADAQLERMEIDVQSWIEASKAR